jgi:hypothetical protein
MLTWVIRRRDPRLAYWLLVLTLPLQLLHRIAWGLLYCPGYLFSLRFFDAYFSMYLGMMLEQLRRIEEGAG